MLKWFVVLLSICGAMLGVSLAFRKPPVYASEIAKEPVRNPFPRSIAGAGLIEPANEAIVIGVAEPGLVTKVWIKKGQDVKKGDPLFKTDARVLENQLPVLEADIQSATAQLERTKAFRRKEDEPLLRAKVAAAEASLLEAATAIKQATYSASEQDWLKKDQQAKLARLEMTSKAGASSIEEVERVQFALSAVETRVKGAQEAIAAAQARERASAALLDQAKADLNTYLAGAWAPDVKLAEAAVATARAKLEQTTREIDRRVVRAPSDAVVIRLNLREGEFATTADQRPENAPVVLGNMTEIHVRVDIDEFDAEKFKPGMKGVMYLRSDRRNAIPLEFVSVEPYIIPKRALTNSQRELVDTRVLQVLYRVADKNAHVYVGQQVDIFFELPDAPQQKTAL